MQPHPVMCLFCKCEPEHAYLPHARLISVCTLGAPASAEGSAESKGRKNGVGSRFPGWAHTLFFFHLQPFISCIGAGPEWKLARGGKPKGLCVFTAGSPEEAPERRVWMNGEHRGRWAGDALCSIRAGAPATCPRGEASVEGGANVD